jgi:hypothetical protein
LLYRVRNRDRSVARVKLSSRGQSDKLCKD